MVEKARQRRLGGRPPAALAAGTGVVGQPGQTLGNLAGRDPGQAAQDFGRGDEGFRHEGLPAPRPALAAREPADHPGLATLFPHHPVRTAPVGHGTVAGVGPAVAGFLVAPQREPRMASAQARQHRGHLTDPDDQGRAAGRQRGAEVDQRFANKGPVPTAGVGLGPEPGLDHVERQQRAPGRGLGERRMVLPAQVALEPDDLDGDEGHGESMPQRRGLCASAHRSSTIGDVRMAPRPSLP
jgi:hypothetical protein